MVQEPSPRGLRPPRSRPWRPSSPQVWRLRLRGLARFLFGALILSALALFVLWRSENPRVQSVRLALIDRAAPVLEAVAGPTRTVGALVGQLRSLEALRAENARLRAELARLQGSRAAAREAAAENAELRALGAVTPASPVAFVTAEVIADAGGPYARSVVVNVGRDDGVEDGAPALDAGGLVGRVVGLGERASRVMLLTDPSSRAPAFVGPDRLRALVIGDERARPRLILAEPEHLAADPAAADAALLAGALVTTSGEGGVFPRGLPIGQLARGDADAAWRVTLSGDPRRLSFLRLHRRPIDRDAVGAAGLIRRFDPDGSGAPPEPSGSAP